MGYTGLDDIIIGSRYHYPALSSRAGLLPVCVARFLERLG